MKDLKRTRNILTGASVGVAVAAAFVNVALIVVKLVQTVTDDAPVKKAE